MEQKVYKVWSYHKVKNFGDTLTIPILNTFKPKNIVFEQCKNIKHADVVGIGSVIQSLPENFRGYIWTSGSLGTSAQISPQAKIYGVRGPKTAELLDLKSDTVFGDGALLLPYLPQFKKKPKKKYQLGIVPHYVDQEYMKAVYARTPQIKFINVKQPFHKVVTQIRQCHCILSSSLHGLIVADAFNIPNRQFRVSTSKNIKGKFFKFRDYYASLGLALPKFIQLNPKLDLRSYISFVKKYYQKKTNMKSLQNKLKNQVLHFMLELSSISSKNVDAEQKKPEF